MNFATLGWAPALIATIGGFIILAGVIGYIAELILADRQHRRAMRRFDVGRDVKPTPDSRSSIELFNRIRSQR
jgi:hypothetical protein